uniref:Uncharacterized protein n=1 Tax=viral metagenome TaxID=1070528 RepID=A0A6M3KZM5_9ZZZZ
MRITPRLPRHDEIYFAGVAWLNSLGAEAQDHEAVMEWYRRDMGPGARHSDPFPEWEG